MLIDHEGQQDARLNLALEEYLVRHYDVSDGAFVLLYINAPAVIVGRHQNVWEEVNVTFCRQRGIPVLRRISGGGAVYHDRGNLNISFITRHTLQNFNKYRAFLQPVLDALAGFHISAQLDERNNLVIHGKKISGNAQFTSRQTLLSHGTLLYNSDLHVLRTTLQAEQGRVVASKGTPSTPSSVTNVALHLEETPDMAAFRSHLLRAFNLEEQTPRRLLKVEWDEVRRLARSKYGDWQWNFGRSPACVIEKQITIAGKTVPLHLHIDGGRITDIQPVTEEKTAALRELKGVLSQAPYEYEALKKIVDEEISGPVDLSALLQGL